MAESQKKKRLSRNFSGIRYRGVGKYFMSREIFYELENILCVCIPCKNVFSLIMYLDISAGILQQMGKMEYVLKNDKILYYLPYFIRLKIFQFNFN